MILVKREVVLPLDLPGQLHSLQELLSMRAASEVRVSLRHQRVVQVVVVLLVPMERDLRVQTGLLQDSVVAVEVVVLQDHSLRQGQ